MKWLAFLVILSPFLAFAGPGEPKAYFDQLSLDFTLMGLETASTIETLDDYAAHYVNDDRVYDELSREIVTYRNVLKLLSMATPEGLARLTNQARQGSETQLPDNFRNEIRRRSYSGTPEIEISRKVIKQVVGQIFQTFDMEIVFPSTNNAASFAAMIAIRSLEEKYPLNEIISAINFQFTSTPFHFLKKFRREEFGTSTVEFLEYLQRYRPHIHPFIQLMAAGVLDSAGFSNSLNPNLNAENAYAALKKEIVMKTEAGAPRATPHLLYGGHFEDISFDLKYIDTWFKRAGLEVTDWAKFTAATTETQLKAAALAKRELPLLFDDCDGFLKGR